MNLFPIRALLTPLQRNLMPNFAKWLLIATGMGVSQLAAAHGAAMSKTGQGSWQLDTLLSYSDTSEPVLRGVLPQQRHYDQPGLRLKHLDVSRDFYLSDPMALKGLISLGYHGDELELEQAWLQPQWQSWKIKVGQLLPDIGWLNQRHSHALMITDRPLVYKAMWAGQSSEAGVSADFDYYAASGNWHVSTSVLTTQERNTRGNSGALLTSVSWQRQFNTLVLSAKADVYWASLQQSGLQLFTEGASHSHGDNATEFFTGHTLHGGLALKLHWNTLAGQWTVLAEQQLRRETGALSSAAGQPLDAQADLELNATGQYLQVGWQSAQQQWQLALRYDTFDSDLDLTRVNGRDLQQSLLNHQNEQPSVLTLAASRALWPGSRLHLQWYEALSYGDDLPTWQLLLQQSARF